MADKANETKPIDAHVEGQQAFHDGKPEDANPYDMLTEELRYLDWNDGWSVGAGEDDF